ncbi:receptor-like protein EIX1 isoform X1 [Salvia hispanica]|uniref:receptor-like protein EIX1 isoform X1 n=1 Tax=Salvia hispanica TaxID=49212 RepID=UPI0020099936|nr:receptor-like protein EIX1 isoform X1 [Salvia hispanica]XP_047951567.1 receptor-like protein EIX1 isoform X1 [Salvia hispanica]
MMTLIGLCTQTFQLDNLNLAWCKVGPFFPKWLQTQSNLGYLNLNGTNITDEVPRWLWSTSPSLQYLFLSYNQISGTVPNLLTTSIRYMDLSNNQFRGPIPLFPVNASHIQLNGNMFSGSISSLCKTPHDYLEYFDLSNNQLAGEVPNCWDKMPSLRYLNLANNSFLGEIPPSFGNLKELLALLLHGNGFSGVLPHNLRQCQELRIIDIGRNKLTGEIPTWIGKLYQMQFLNFRGNKLHGSIPPEICNLTIIQVLDLSINVLSSIIPNCFNNFTLLASESISDTFAYVVTLGTRFGGYETWEYEYSSFQWKGLCGDPLPMCPEDSLKPSTTNSRDNMNDNDGNIFSFMQEVGISMGFGFIFGFWGVIGSFILKKSWRIVFFSFLDGAGDWFYVRIAEFVSKWRRS